jgi:hypothetical protein
MSIQLKLLFVVVACLAGVATVNAWLAEASYQRELRAAGEQTARASAQAFATLEQREVDKLSSTLDALMGDSTIVSFFAQRDRDRLYETAAPIFQELKERHGVTHWYFIDPAPARTCFLRVHRPDLHDDVVGRATLLAAIKLGETAAGKELGQTAFALRVVRPFVAHGKLLGYMELGEEIDDFVARMKAQTGDDFALVLQKKHLDEKAWAASRGAQRNDWGDDPEVVVAVATAENLLGAEAGVEVRDVPDEGRYLSTVSRGERVLVRTVVPVSDAAGRKVGGIIALHDVTALSDRVKSERNRTILVLGAFAAATVLLLSLLVHLLVFRRIQRMTSTMQDVSTRLAGGDYDVGDRLHATSGDEIGRFETFLASFLSTIGSTLKDFDKRQRRNSTGGQP